MTRFASFVSVILPLFTMAVNGHMTMSSPAPFRFKGNPNTLPGNVDFDYAKPLAASGSDYPCKGYLSVLGTPEGKPVDTWAAGSSKSFVVEGGAAHGGGSCQAAISEDGGASFKVIASYIGNCPVSGQSMPFTVPSETKAGTVVFSWTWFNKIGNREMYMNCAAVTVTGGGSGLSAYPDLFKANIGNGCTTVDGTDVEFPNPGSAVTRSGAGTPPSGSCGSSSGTSPVTPPAPSDGSDNEAPVTSTRPARSPSATGDSRSTRYPRASGTSSVPETSPSDEPEVPICQRSVRYTRSLPVAVQPGCMCSCENNVPKPVCGSSYL